jgi:hypothetical protein
MIQIETKLAGTRERAEDRERQDTNRKSPYAVHEPANRNRAPAKGNAQVTRIDNMARIIN